MAGPDQDPQTELEQPREHPPGEFVSDELETATARFLSELRHAIAHRREPVFEDEGE